MFRELTLFLQPSFKMGIIIVHITEMHKDGKEFAHNHTANWRCQYLNLSFLTQESSDIFILKKKLIKI